MRDPVLRGREAQLSVLLDHLDALVMGQGGTVVVHGAAGMGKTRLLHEAMTLGARRGAVVRFAACDVLTRSIPFASLLSVLDAPLLVALDDLQWADPSALAALTVLAGNRSGPCVLWLIATRSDSPSPPVTAALERLAADGATRIDVGPLDPHAVAELIRDVLGAEPVHGAAAAVAGLEAQPLFVVELLRGLREEGSVDLTTATLPRRVRALILRQLRQLPESVRHAVQLGAALGNRFTGAELAVLAGCSSAALLAVLEEAISAGLLVPHSDHLGFRHALVRDAVEASVPAAVFSALRRSAVGVRLDHSKWPVEVARSWLELTDAECQVAQLAATGSTNRAIAAQMYVSPHTVNSHLRHIYEKLGVRSRVALTRLVIERAHRVS